MGVCSRYIKQAALKRMQTKTGNSQELQSVLMEILSQKAPYEKLAIPDLYDQGCHL